MPCVYLPGPAPAVTVANTKDCEKKVKITAPNDQIQKGDPCCAVRRE